MSAEIIQFRPRPNPNRDTAQLIQSMYDLTWGPYFAWAAMMGAESEDVDRYLSCNPVGTTDSPDKDSA